MTLADRIAVLNAGRVEQVVTPREVYHRPANLFVAGFIGSPTMNLIPVTAGQGRLALPWGDHVAEPAAEPVATPVATPVAAPVALSGPGTLGLRPDRLSLVPSDQAQATGQVTRAEHLGDETILHIRVGDRPLTVKLGGDVAVHLGDTVHIGFDPTGARLFGLDAKPLR